MDAKFANVKIFARILNALKILNVRFKRFLVAPRIVHLFLHVSQLPQKINCTISLNEMFAPQNHLLSSCYSYSIALLFVSLLKKSFSLIHVGKQRRSLNDLCPFGPPLMMPDTGNPFLCGLGPGKPACPPAFDCDVQLGNLNSLN